MQATFL